MNVHQNYDSIESVALHYAKEHKCNYTIILMNPVNGEFGEGSTYEFVADSYFEKDRPNCIILKKTDDILGREITGEELEDTGSTVLNNLFGTSMPITIGHHDFRYQQNANAIYPTKPIISNKIGRNETCPCGSGLKYKRCCSK